ncbi:MAG: hypothetical protein H7233_00105 [Pseudorhodobacter sp.]|nr:hypothetical protein [Frankiaceae bacterium]
MSPVATRRLRRGALLTVLAATFGWVLAGGSWLGVELREAFAGATGGSARSTFTISGHTARGVEPGTSVPLNLTLTNDQGHPLSIDRLSVSLRDVDAPRSDADHPCTLDDFVVRQAPDGLGLVLPGEVSASLQTLGVPVTAQPHVSMLNTSHDQDGCKGASIRLDFLGTGRQVGR